MLNTSSVPSSGLFNGRVGLALALFQYAHEYNDNWVEEEAFELLQQSLVANIKDPSLEGGLSGIGYGLLYLINNHLIEVNFEEIFGQKHRLIMDCCKHLSKEDLIVRFARIVHYLYGHYHFSGSRLSLELAQKIAFLTTDFLLSSITQWEEASLFEKDSIKLNQTMTDYILLAIHYPELYDLDLVMERYQALNPQEQLHRNEAVLLVSRIIGFSSRAERGLLSLRELLNLAIIERKLGETRFWNNELFSILDGDNLESSLVNRVHVKQYLPSYGFGIARLLLYLTVMERPAMGLLPDFV